MGIDFPTVFDLLRPLDAGMVPDEKYNPFVDADKNGTIIISLIGEETKAGNEMVFLNVSDTFTEAGMPPPESARMRKYDLGQCVDRHLLKDSLDEILACIDDLYKNTLAALSLQNVPGLTYESLATEPIPEDTMVVQWDRSDLDKVKAHIRMLYDSQLPRQ